MNNIKGLIKKDLYNLSSYKMTVLVLVAFIALFGSFSEDSIQFIPIAISAAIGMIMLSTFNYDESSKSEHYILSLPTNKREVIKSKYILIILGNIIGSIIGVIITILAAYIVAFIKKSGIPQIDYGLIFTYALGGFFGVSLIEAIQIPSIYKWGAEKGRIQMFILIFILVMLIIGIVYISGNITFNIDLAFLENLFGKYGVLLEVLMICLMYFISYKVSNKIYKNKE